MGEARVFKFVSEVNWASTVHPLVFVIIQADGHSKPTFNITRAVKKPRLNSSQVMM